MLIHMTTQNEPVKKLEIKIGDSVFFATMLDEQAPKTCRAIFDILPLEGEALHATWSGDMIFVPLKRIPVQLEAENQTIYPSRGDMALYLGLKELYIIYGQAQLRVRFGPAPSNLFARITENLKELKETCKRIHREGTKKITIKPAL